MDATHRPLKIPSEFSIYADKYNIFDLNKRLLQQLIVDKPDDPIQYLIDILVKENDEVPNIMVLGPPASGKYTVGKMLAGRLACIHLTMKGVFQEAEREIKEQVEECLLNKKPIPIDAWVAGLKHRTSFSDCNRKGWVLSGFPQTREQAITLQSNGIFAKHVVNLGAPDNVLIERAAGKRIDPITGDVYHINFEPPVDEEVTNRLTEVPGNTEQEMVARLTEYHRNIFNLTLSYPNVVKDINADQPMADVMAQALDFVANPERSVAPRNPRIVVLGPPGSGKTTQAALLHSKYRLVDVDCGDLVRRVIADKNKMSGILKPYVDKKQLVPDTLIGELIKDRLKQNDCVTRGWVLHNFPKTRSQAEALDAAGLEPSRVILLDTPNHIVIERMANQRIDPVTGAQYHLVYNPPTNNSVSERLVQHPNCKEAYLQRKLALYRRTVDEIMEYYNNVHLIPADQEIHTVFELIETHVVNSIPHSYD